MIKKHRALASYQAYVLATFLIFYFGPIAYPITNITETSTLLILYNLAFIFGYFLAYRHTVLYNIKFKSIGIGIKPLIIVGLLLNIYFSIAYLISFSGSTSFFSDIIEGITNPGEAYQKNILIEGKASLLTKMTTLFSPLTYCVIPLGVYHYKKFGKLLSLLFFVSIALMMSTYIVKGTNFLIIFLVITIMIVSYFTGRFDIRKVSKISLSKKVLFSLAIFYFFYSISSRMQLEEIPGEIYEISINQEHALFRYLPDAASIPLMLGTSYISQGYYGLSLAPYYDFPATSGLGNGMFIIGKLDPNTQIDIWTRTYQSQMEIIWDPRTHWHTAYVWFANDVGLYGVIVVMALIGFLFSLILRDAYENRSSLALILLPLYVIMLLFTPSNNIIFNTPMLFMSFITFNFLWIFTKKWKFKI